MKIGVDIDGVLTDIATFQLERGSKYFGKIINKNGYEIRDIFDCSRIKESEFWLKNLDYYKMSARDGSSEFLYYLKNKGFDIYIISARNLLLRKYTNYWLKTNNIYYDKIIYSNDKLKATKDNNVDIMIEDSPKNLILLSQYIPMICMKTFYNEMIDNSNIYMAHSIDEMYSFVDEITSNMSKIKKKNLR